MRRWLAAVATGCVVAVALSGCGNPGGVDGELTDDWAVLGEPKPFVPDAGVCHAKADSDGSLGSYEPLDCAQTHEVETIHVGAFTGTAASRTRPPQADSAAMQTAFDECDKKATEALGAEWRSARLSLQVLLPSATAWEGGAHWFRCDLSEVKSLDDDTYVDRTGSLKGALTDSSPLSHGCFNPKMTSDKRYIEEMVPIACDKAHHSEFVGIYTATATSFDAFDNSSTDIHKGCLKLIASYVDVPDDKNLEYRSGTIYYAPGRDEWDAGDHGVKCFLWLSKRTLTRSVKGAGGKALPVS